MKSKNLLNEKKLSKAQVQAILREQGKLDAELMEAFCERRPDGSIFEQDLVYELNDGNFLVVRDPSIKREGGKGDIWKREFMHRFSSWSKEVKEDYAQGRSSSTEHWRYYSKYKNKLIDNVDLLIQELSHRLNIDILELGKSYDSLDLVSAKVEKLGQEVAKSELYDNLVAYVGEVIKSRVQGQWKLDSIFNVPYVGIENGRVYLNPVNIVWSELGSLEPMNLRKATVSEIRNVSQFHKIVKQN